MKTYQERSIWGSRSCHCNYIKPSRKKMKPRHLGGQLSIRDPFQTNTSISRILYQFRYLWSVYFINHTSFPFYFVNTLTRTFLYNIFQNCIKSRLRMTACLVFIYCVTIGFYFAYGYLGISRHAFWVVLILIDQNINASCSYFFVFDL